MREDFERPGCPVMIANGLYQVNEKWPDVALRMLQDHLTDTTRTCCDEHGFALLDPETGCTFQEIEDPSCYTCGHLKSEHLGDFCDVYGCRCGETSFRIRTKPVQFATAAQGHLFGKEIA